MYTLQEIGQNQHEKGGWAYNTSWAYNTYSTVCVCACVCMHLYIIVCVVHSQKVAAAVTALKQIQHIGKRGRGKWQDSR